MIDIKNLITLSKTIEAKRFGATRTTILDSLEQMLDPKIQSLSITTLSSLAMIASNIGLNNPIYWRTLGEKIIPRAHLSTEHNSDTLSVIFFCYVTRFPVMPNNFFESLEKRLVINSRFLSSRSTSQVIWSFSKRQQAHPATIKCFESLAASRLNLMNYIDLGQVCLAMSMFKNFGNTPEFQKNFYKVVLENMKNIDMRNLLFIARGLAAKNWYLEGFFQFLCESSLQKVEKLSGIEIRDLAFTLAEFEKGIEVPFMERLQEIRIEEGMVKDKNLY